jgi:hypothetical protein
MTSYGGLWLKEIQDGIQVLAQKAPKQGAGQFVARRFAVARIGIRVVVRTGFGLELGLGSRLWLN